MKTPQRKLHQDLWYVFLILFLGGLILPQGDGREAIKMISLLVGGLHLYLTNKADDEDDDDVDPYPFV